jgi:succinyl-CoA synthetase alpha subunit
VNRPDIAHELEPLFNPRSVAVIGATENWNKWGFSTFSSVLDRFGGEVYPVNSRAESILGHKSFRRVTDIPEPVDLAVFVIPATAIPSVMEDCAASGVRAGIIITAGFAETGEAGQKLQDEVLGAARKGGLRFVGPNCMGLWSASSNLMASMFPMLVEDGPLAFVSQGGNIGGAVVMSAYQRGIGFHRYVSCGCTADIQIEDYIEYFGDDPAVEVILTYIEGVNDGRRFIEKVSRVTRRKPVIALKPGKTDAASKAIRSHSGALAGQTAMYDAVFRKAGVIRVDAEEELLDVALGFLTQPLPRGRNVAIVTPGGSYGVLCADACASDGLHVVALPEKTIAELDRIFPPRWSRGNPIDPAGDRNFIAYLTAPPRILDLDEVDALIFMGLGDFSGFADMISSLGASASRASGQLLPSAEEIGRALAPFLGILASGDPARIGRSIGDALSRFGPLAGIGDETDSANFSAMLADAIASGEIDVADLAQSLEAAAATGATTRTLAEAVDAILGGLVRFWIRSYGKPVITTSFTEALPRLQGKFLSYPSGRRASSVLVKLTEYGEYLDGQGLGREGRGAGGA